MPSTTPNYDARKVIAKEVATSIAAVAAVKLAFYGGAALIAKYINRQGD